MVTLGLVPGPPLNSEPVTGLLPASDGCSGREDKPEAVGGQVP